VLGLNADISNSHFEVKFVGGTAHSLVIGGKGLIGDAKGFYCSINCGTDFSAKSLHIASNSSSMVDIYYSSDWENFNDINGIYSYFVTTGIGEVGQ
jgi:hypothetical protein